MLHSFAVLDFLVLVDDVVVFDDSLELVYLYVAGILVVVYLDLYVLAVAAQDR